jgi:hypothetical protein
MSEKKRAARDRVQHFLDNYVRSMRQDGFEINQNSGELAILAMVGAGMADDLRHVVNDIDMMWWKAKVGTMPAEMFGERPVFSEMGCI